MWTRGKQIVATTTAMAVLATGISAQSGGSFDVKSSVIASGGSQSLGPLKIESTVGESTAGTLLRNPPFSQSPGFWPTTIAPNQPTAAPATISGTVTTTSGAPLGGVVVTLAGRFSGRTITNANGFYSFVDVATDEFYVVTPVLTNYSFSPANRAFSLLENNTNAIFTAVPDLNPSGNPLDMPEFFVRQQYLDFLNREPDPFGFAGWTSTLNNCAPGDTSCDRIHVSQLFFQSAEFQERGYFVYRFYPVAFGRKPDYGEFVPDLASVSGFLDANQLEATKLAFIAGFMARPAFVSAYNSLNNTQYVDTLISTAAVTFSASTRQAMIDGLNNSTLTRGQVLRQIVESAEVSTKYNHQAYAVWSTLVIYDATRTLSIWTGSRYWMRPTIRAGW